MDKDALDRHADLAGVIIAAFDNGPMIASRSALRSTMTGATPPCSSAQRVPGASFVRRYQPTFAEPMKLKKATRAIGRKGFGKRAVFAKQGLHPAHPAGLPRERA